MTIESEIRDIIDGYTWKEEKGIMQNTTLQSIRVAEYVRSKLKELGKEIYISSLSKGHQMVKNGETWIPESYIDETIAKACGEKL